MSRFIFYLLFIVTVTAYHPKNNKEDIAYLGSKIVPHKTVAVSHDLKHLLGCEIYLEGIGWRFVNDLTAENWKKRIDICLPTKTEAMEWGKQKSFIKHIK